MNTKNIKMQASASYEAPALDVLCISVEQGFAMSDQWNPDPTVPDKPNIIDPYNPVSGASDYFELE